MLQRLGSNLSMALLVILLGATTRVAPASLRQPLPAAQPHIFLPLVSQFASAVVVGAGDIADCSTPWDEATAKLVSGIPGTVVTLGDNVYETGTAAEFKNCYDPSWGQFKNRTRPSPGNHDYASANAAPYFSYFGAAAGDPNTGYYSYDLGGWHIVSLNGNCDLIGGCQPGSPQEQWLRADLAAHPAACTLAYWHQPRFSSGLHGSDWTYAALWQALYDYHADLVLNGHDHDYERFAPQTPTGRFDANNGIREFVVGTGGRHFSVLGPVRQPNSELVRAAVYGVIKLTLYPASYHWEFKSIPGIDFQDVGDGQCH